MTSSWRPTFSRLGPPEGSRRQARADRDAGGAAPGAREGWLILAIASAADAGLSPLQLQRSLFLLRQKRVEQALPDFYEFESHESGPLSRDLNRDLDALVAAEYVVKTWRPECSWSVLRLSDAGQAWATAVRRKANKETLGRLEDAVAWVKEQGYLDLVHKTPTIRVVG